MPHIPLEQGDEKVAVSQERQKKLCQQMKFKTKIAEMYRASPSIAQTQGKVEGEEEGLGNAPPIWARGQL